MFPSEYFIKLINYNQQLTKTVNNMRLTSKKHIISKSLMEVCLFVFITLTTISCSKESDKIEIDNQTKYRLKNCRIEYLIFADNIKFSSFTKLYYPPTQGEIIQTEFTYSDDKLSQVKGGFIFSYSVGLVFTHMIYDSIVHNENNTDVYTKPIYFSNSLGNFYKDEYFRYNIDNSNHLRNIRLIDGSILTYTYSGETITEKNSSGKVIRTFKFSNKNLVSVEQIVGDKESGSYYVVEYRFNNYDNKPNPLKGKFYMEGAFYRSFSENNYLDFNKTISVFEKGVYTGFLESYWFKMTFTYNADGYPNFGEYEVVGSNAR